VAIPWEFGENSDCCPFALRGRGDCFVASGTPPLAMTTGRMGRASTGARPYSGSKRIGFTRVCWVTFLAGVIARSAAGTTWQSPWEFGENPTRSPLALRGRGDCFVASGTPLLAMTTGRMGRASTGARSYRGSKRIGFTRVCWVTFLAGVIARSAEGTTWQSPGNLGRTPPRSPLALRG